MTTPRIPLSALTDSSLVIASLDLCTTMLHRCGRFYPFAAYHHDQELRCIFTEEPAQSRGKPHMIERLQIRLQTIHQHREDIVSVLVYDATVANDKGESTPAIVVSELNGASARTQLFPYTRLEQGIGVGIPYNMHQE